MTRSRWVAAFVLLLPALGWAQGLTLSIRPGLLTQGASFGIDYRRWNPIAGLDLLWIGTHYKTDNSDDYTYNSDFESYRSVRKTSDNLDGRAIVVVPHVGARYYLKQGREQKPLGLFLRGAWFFSVPTVQISGEETVERWEYVNGDITDYERMTTDHPDWKDDEDRAEEVLSFWGLDFALGMEYPFSPHFAVGGEYGLRLFWNSVSDGDESSSSWGNPGSTSRDSWNEELNATLRLTYAAVSLHYKL